MNHQSIIKRAWKILFSYKTLWVFGIILALTTASSSGGGGGGGSSQHNNNGNAMNFSFGQAAELQPELDSIREGFEQARQELVQDWKDNNFDDLPWGIIIPVGILVLAISVLFIIANLVSKVALIKMVDRYETSGEKVTWKEGFRLGWSRAAWRIFLLELLIGITAFLGIALSLGCIALPFLMAGGVDKNWSIGAIVAGVGLFFMLVFMVILFALAVSIILEPVYRACVLENLGVGQSISRGWRLVKANFKDLILMWLILFGIQIAFLIVMIPVALIIGGIGLVLGGGLGLAVFFLSKAISDASLAWIPAAVVGGLLFMVLFGAPMTFINGLKETYLSTTWTLTYRELRLPVSTRNEKNESGGEVIPA